MSDSCRRWLRRVDLQDVGDQVPVGEHHPLRQPRRPARVGERDDVAWRDRYRRRSARLRQQLVERPRAVHRAERESIVLPLTNSDCGFRLQADVAYRLQGRLSYCRRRDQDLRAAVAQLLLDVLGRAERTRGRHDRAEFCDGEHRNREVGSVRAEDRADVPFGEPESSERRRGAIDKIAELRVGDRPSGHGVDQRGLCAALTGARQHEIRERHIRNRDRRMGAAVDRHGAWILHRRPTSDVRRPTSDVRRPTSGRIAG